MPRKRRKARELSAGLRREFVKTQTWVAGLVVACVWAVVVFRYFVGRDQFKPGIEDPETTTFYVWAATIASIAVLLWAVREGRRALALAEYGVKVTGVVTDCSSVAVAEVATIYYGYVVDSTTYYNSTTIPQSDAKGMRLDSPVLLLVDPRNPNNAKPYSEVLPERYGDRYRTLDDDG